MMLASRLKNVKMIHQVKLVTNAVYSVKDAPINVKPEGWGVGGGLGTGGDFDIF